MKVLIRFAAALAALSLVVVAPFSARAADPVEINVIIPVTGGAAFIGKGYISAFNALEAYVNKHGGIRGRPLKFIIADDASNPQNAVQLFSPLVEKKVGVVLGGALAAECNAMQALIRDGPMLYCLTPAIHPEPGSFVFSAEPSTNDQLFASVHYFRQRGLTRIAVITTTDASGQDADRTIAEAMGAANNRGVTEVEHEHFNPTDLSVSAQIERIKAANPQLLIGWVTGTSFGTVLRAVNDSGLNVPVYTHNGNLSYAAMTQYHDFLPKELDFPATSAVVPDGITDRGVKTAVNVYFQSLRDIGVRPEFIPSVAYDPALLVITALRDLGPDATAAQIRDHINRVKDWPGANGRYDFPAFPQRGLGSAAGFVARWDPAKSDWTAVSKPGGDPR